MTRKDYILLAEVFIAVRKNTALDVFTVGHIEGYLARALKAKHENFDVQRWISYIDGGVEK